MVDARPRRSLAARRCVCLASSSACSVAVSSRLGTGGGGGSDGVLGIKKPMSRSPRMLFVAVNLPRRSVSVEAGAVSIDEGGVVARAAHSGDGGRRPPEVAAPVL